MQNKTDSGGGATGFLLIRLLYAAIQKVSELILFYARLQQLIKAIGIQPIRYVPRVEVYLYILYACILRLHSGSWRIECSPACYYVDLQVYLDSCFCCLHRIVRLGLGVLSYISYVCYPSLHALLV